MKPGDTASGIALTLGIPLTVQTAWIQQLLTLNNTTAGALQVGQDLKLPPGTASSGAAQPASGPVSTVAPAQPATQQQPTAPVVPTAASPAPTAAPTRRASDYIGSANPPADFCSFAACIPNFGNGRGVVVQCKDGLYSKSGGISGSCSGHGGNGP